MKKKYNIKAKDLSEAIYLLGERQLISDKSKYYSNLIRVYGNTDSHYNEDVEISNEEIKLLAFRLLSVIEEVLENGLLSAEDLIVSEEKKVKKIYDQNSRQWVIQAS